jgi:hypothetical protein
VLSAAKSRYKATGCDGESCHALNQRRGSTTNRSRYRGYCENADDREVVFARSRFRAVDEMQTEERGFAASVVKKKKLKTEEEKD